jgi:lysozyme family protein
MIDQIITGILEREGGSKYTNKPADRGGPTKWGIIQKSWRKYTGLPVSEADIKAITEEEARDFYKEMYILAPRFFEITNSHLSELVIDCGVNHGVKQAAKWIQIAAGVKKDGVIGPVSLYAINHGDPLRFFMDVLSSRIRLYGRLVTKNRSQAVFAAGWNNRAAGFLDDVVDRIDHGEQPV